MDQFAALFGHSTPTARAFFSGQLCTLADFGDEAESGYLHILRGGKLRILRHGADAIALDRPSVILLPRHAPHQFAPDPGIGADLTCATIQIGGRRGNPIALGLPELMVIPLDSVATIGPTLDLLLAEAFAALADPRLARAVTAMHDKPGHGWTLDDLAEVAGMSRTRFASHFRDVTGSTPMDYLTRWRMTIAQNLLRKGQSIKAVAVAVGYDSPAALTRTFGKVVGRSPRDWMKDLKPAAVSGTG